VRVSSPPQQNVTREDTAKMIASWKGQDGMKQPIETIETQA
jgi:hypothetical protein